jgi:HlyD family secretion protein
MQRKILIPILLVAAVVGIAAVLRSGWLHREDPNRIPLSGNIELTEVDISFKVPGKLVQRTVDEGDFVKKGQLIARIDRDQIDRQKARDTAGVDSAASQVAQSRTSIA